jgi:glycosyltransferase involved in cell wall biosynthesis
VISVIIPTLDEEKLLPGLLAQFDVALCARHDIELVLSDGGSRDRTCAIARERGLTVVQHAGEHRQTIAEGRNAGAAAARGEVLVFVNADIRLSDPDLFFTRVRETLARPGIAAATSRVHVFPEEETRLDRAFHVVHNGYVALLNLVGEGMGRGECQALTREMFERAGRYNEQMAAGEDYDLYRRDRKLGRIVFLSGVVVFESPRRFRKYGYFSIVKDWTRNALAVILRNKSSSDTWDPVR